MLAVAAWSAVVATPVAAASANADERRFLGAGGEPAQSVLVRFASDASRATALARIAGVGKGRIGRTGFERIEARGRSAEAIVAALRRQPGVTAAEPDHPVRVSLAPNDPYYATDPMTGLGQWGLRTAKTDAAWDVQRGSSALTVAVIDTGIDLDHPDLKGAVVPGARFTSSPDGSCTPGTDERDDNGHGTHVAGIAGATAENGSGIAGAAFGVRVMAIKTMDCTGSGRSSDTASAITYAADHGARVVNMSFGGSSYSETVKAAVDYALAKGVVLVAAAGNCGTTSETCPSANPLIYPAAYAGVLAVAATDRTDTKASFSSANASVGIAAPGVRIVSTFPTYPVKLGSKADPYAAMNGTSMASPLVAGIAALLLSKRPELTPTQVTQHLRGTADDLGAAGWDPQYGDGRVNAHRAITSELTAPVPQPSASATPAPTPEPTAPPAPTPAPPAPTPAPTATPAPVAPAPVAPAPVAPAPVAPAPTAAPTPTPAPVTVPPAAGASAFCAAGRSGTATSAVFLPNVTKTLGGRDGWQTPFIVQNRGSANADMELSFYRFSDGECMSRRVIPGLQPGRSYAHSPNDDTGLPHDTQFSVVVRSFGAPVVAVVNQHGGSGTRSQALSYDGFGAGSPSAYLPNVVRRTFGYHTPFVVQNLGAASTTVTARFVPADGGDPVLITRSIASGRSAFVEPNAEPVLRDGARYAVTLSATEPIASVVNAHNESANVAYSIDGQAAGAETLHAPFATKDTARGTVSTIVVQNLGITTVTPTLMFTPLAGDPGAAHNFTAPPIAAGASWAFDPRFTLGTTVPCRGASATCLGDGDYGLVISAPGAHLAASVNVIGPSTAMGYAASTSPTARAYLPNVTRTLGGPDGWTTELFVQSGSASAATLRWYRFGDGSLAHTQTLALGAGRSARVDPRAIPSLGDDAQYAVVIEGIDGSVTAVASQRAAGGDNAMIYEGFAAE